MTWAAQVRHVFVRNVAETWVSLAALVAIIAVVTTQAVVGAIDGRWAGMLLTYASKFCLPPARRHGRPSHLVANQVAGWNSLRRRGLASRCGNARE